VQVESRDLFRATPIILIHRKRSMIGKVLETIYNHHVAKDHCIDIPFNNSELRWLEIELLSQIEMEANSH
jgi:hypothetical protein